MEDFLINLIKTLDYPIFRQGSLTEDDAYPDTFFTYWNNTEDNHSSYDNNTVLIQYNYDLNVYSTDADKCYELLEQASTILKNNNFIISDFGHDLYSDEITHIGRGMNISYLGDYERDD